MTDTDSLQALLDRRVLVCVGCGGVGKTSVAAALSVAAARRGKRVLALTIDPAGRLADSLGVDRRESAHQVISSEKLQRLGVEAGELSVAVLDAQRTLTELVERMAPDADQRQAILSHPLYRYLSDYLAGTNEYMAMEKVLSSLELEQYDLLVLDTPPTRHALDFLRAPERLNDAIGGPVLQAIVRAVDGSRRFSVDWVSKGVASVIRGLGKLTGAGTLEQIATLLVDLSAIFGGFSQRATRVSEAFREPSFGFVLVARPVAGAIEDALFFAAALRERQMRPNALVLNRTHPALSEVDDGLQQLAGSLRAPVLEHVRAAVMEEQALASAEMRRVNALGRDPDLSQCRRWTLPDIEGGVSNLEQLAELTDGFERVG